MVRHMSGARATAHVHVYVPDVDETFARAKQSWWNRGRRAREKDDDNKRGGIADTSGTRWWLATTQGFNIA